MPSSEILDSIVPRSIIIGKGILNKIPKIIRTQRYTQKSLILTGPKTQHIVGNEIQEILSQANIKSEIIIVKDSKLSTADKILEQITQIGSNLIIAAGGGKIIDVGKYCSAKSSRKLEVISVPTSAPHDGIASPFIFLNNPTEVFIGESRPPIAIAADIEKILQHPDLVRNLAAGVGDTVGKLTSIWDWQYAWRIKSEKYSRFVGGVLANADTLFQSQFSEALADPERAIKVVLKALLIAGVLMGTSSDIRVGYGSEHMFSSALHALTPNANILHGERIAIGSLMMAHLQGQDYRKLKDILGKAGCPTSIEELEDDIPPESIIKALQTAHEVNPMYTILGKSGLTEIAAWNLAISTGILESYHKT